MSLAFSIAPIHDPQPWRMHARGQTMNAPAVAARPVATPPAFGEAFRFWLKLGFISFGGPAGQIAIMHEELVERRRWISEKRFLHALNYCMLLPGPEAQQLATYIGWLMHRTWGGIVAGTLFVLPSLAILIALSWVYVTWGQVPAIAGILYGIKPAVTALVLHAAWRIGKRTLRDSWTWTIAIAAFVAIFALALPFPAIIIAAGIAGYVGGRLAPGAFIGGGQHDGGHGHATSDTPATATDAPAHTRYNAAHLLRIVTACVALWAAALLLTYAVAATATLPQLAWLFTKAAFLTFGGAYAVLPYVVQASVDTFHWLTPAQMIDGLALGETTPGPLIMIVAFVGYLAAHSAEVFGSQLFLAGCAGALVATFFTFLPSFLFILAGGPLVEATHGNRAFTAPLTGITAAVVGVIVNLALFFAWHVFWPSGHIASPDYPSLLIFAAGVIALFRFKAGVIPLIASCGIAGLLLRLLAP
jgi:chromate transporter